MNVPGTKTESTRDRGVARPEAKPQVSEANRNPERAGSVQAARPKGNQPQSHLGRNIDIRV
jgi:hypothetical protein